MTLQQYLPDNLFAAFLIFCRIGATMMLLPGFGELYVPQRLRLLLALMMAALLTPVLAPILPPLPATTGELGILVFGEVMIGVFVGTLARILVSALETAGMMISMQLGLSTATMFNPLADQSASPLPSALYGMLGVVLIFLTDMDHLLLRASVESYGLFTPGALPPLGDLTDMVVRFAAGSFRLAFEMAAPFIVLGLVFFTALGIVARMVPQLQVLFIAQPLQILGGLALFAVVLTSGMRWFLEAFVQQFSFLAPG
ncbi:MAG TPA: flagellar biosynthetic protein FliR [Stellaceae bacterium]|nr:flagellar biosynthetic protein FliR [Stellaceae bacterium]